MAVRTLTRKVMTTQIILTLKRRIKRPLKPKRLTKKRRMRKRKTIKVMTLTRNKMPLMTQMKRKRKSGGKRMIKNL
jgi:hypothetical protein